MQLSGKDVRGASEMSWLMEIQKTRTKTIIETQMTVGALIVKLQKYDCRLPVYAEGDAGLYEVDVCLEDNKKSIRIYPREVREMPKKGKKEGKGGGCGK
jgi:hypothetical protein